jgi:EAL domain-containing protein (putative c-di-GMP-specific phosphodiesterase class I)
MDVAVVAEGIETQAELDTVAAIGAHFAQGFHLGRPRPLSEQPELTDTVVELSSLEPEEEVDLREPARDDIDHPT